MKTTIFLCIAFLLNSFSFLSAQSYDQITEGYYGHGTLYADSDTHWKYYIPANSLGIFTLKNTSYTSDVDLFIYNDEGQYRKLNAGTKGGTKTELIQVNNGSTYGKYVYIEVRNVGHSTAKYRLHAHHINFGEKLGEALVMTAGKKALEGIFCWLADADCNTVTHSQKNAARAANVALSFINGESLGTTARGVVKHEITTKLRKEFGYGFMADFAVSFAIDVIDDIYRFY